jgi:two-component system OmpR family sensor kinase
LLPEEIAVHGDKPFTIDAPGSDFRVVARAIPNNGGTVIAAQSLADLDRTSGRLGFLFSLIGLILYSLSLLLRVQLLKLVCGL